MGNKYSLTQTFGWGQRTLKGGCSFLFFQNVIKLLMMLSNKVWDKSFTYAPKDFSKRVLRQCMLSSVQIRPCVTWRKGEMFILWLLKRELRNCYSWDALLSVVQRRRLALYLQPYCIFESSRCLQATVGGKDLHLQELAFTVFCSIVLSVCGTTLITPHLLGSDCVFFYLHLSWEDW